MGCSGVEEVDDVTLEAIEELLGDDEAFYPSILTEAISCLKCYGTDRHLSATGRYVKRKPRLDEYDKT